LSKNGAEWKRKLESLSVASPAQLRKYAEDYFHIDKGVEFYRQVYQNLITEVKESKEKPREVLA
jgi:hypothetical protein